MKILVIQILRFGDVLLSLPTVNGLKEKYKGSEMHLLLDRSSESLQAIIKNVDAYHYFDRQQIQESTSDLLRSIFEPLDRSRALLTRLNMEQYDLVVNLSHTRVSGWLCGAIKARERLGLALSGDGQASWGSPWFSYMNEHLGAEGKSSIHISDVYYYGSGLIREPKVVLYNTDEESEKIVEKKWGKRTYICVQAFSSDKKKDLANKSWVKALKIFSKLANDISIVVLAAPFEKERAESLAKECHDQGVKVEVEACGWSLALSILRRCQMLITVDTSVKHLASGAGVKVLEVALGSSDPFKTGVYSSNCYVVSSRVKCAPCSHRADCTQRSHLCGEAMNSEFLGVLIHKIHTGDRRGVEILAREWREEVYTYQTVNLDNGFWQATEVGAKSSETGIKKLIEISSWKLLCQREHRKPVGEFGSEAMRIKSSIQQVYPDFSNKWGLPEVSLLESSEVERAGQIELARAALQGLARGSELDSMCGETIARIIAEETNDVAAREALKNLARLNRPMAPRFEIIRRQSSLIDDALNRSQIKVKLLRSLKSQIMECI